jgi:hypothetical protein
MAIRTISDTGGNWSSASTWAEGVAPTLADSVVATASSGNVTVDQDFTVASFDLTNYTKVFSDGGYTCTVNGNILIPATAGIFASSGYWIQGASGNISNPRYSNAFRNLSIAALGATTTLTATLQVGGKPGSSLTIGTGVLFGNQKYLLFTTYDASPNLTINNPTMGSALNRLYFAAEAAVTLPALTVPNNFGIIDIVTAAAKQNIVAGGDLNLGNNSLQIGHGYGNQYLDMVSYSIITTGTLAIGEQNNPSPGWLKLGTSQSHSVGLIRTFNLGNQLDMDSATITCKGSANLTNCTVNCGTSTLKMTGANAVFRLGYSRSGENHILFRPCWHNTCHDGLAGWISAGLCACLSNGRICLWAVQDGSYRSADGCNCGSGQYYVWGLSTCANRG